MRQRRPTRSGMTGSCEPRDRTAKAQGSDSVIMISLATPNAHGHLRQEPAEDGGNIVRRVRDRRPVDIFAETFLVISHWNDDEPSRKENEDESSPILVQRQRSGGSSAQGQDHRTVKRGNRQTGTDLRGRVKDGLNLPHPLVATRNSKRALDLGGVLLEISAAVAGEGVSSTRAAQRCSGRVHHAPSCDDRWHDPLKDFERPGQQGERIRTERDDDEGRPAGAGRRQGDRGREGQDQDDMRQRTQT